MAAVAPHEGSTTSAALATSPEVGYPNGHLGHLNERETRALEDFKALITEKGEYSPGPPPSHDDQTLLFVRPCPVVHGRRCRKPRKLTLDHFPSLPQEIPPRPSMGARGCLQAVQGHRRLAGGDAVRRPLRHHRSRRIRAEQDSGALRPAGPSKAIPALLSLCECGC